MSKRDIDLYFELSYCNYLVIDHLRAQHLDQAWHLEVASMIDQMRRAFPDVTYPHEYLALAGFAGSPDGLSEAEMTRLGVTYDDSEETGLADEPYFYRNQSYEGPEWLTFADETPEVARNHSRIVVPRALLQSMPREWQIRFVELLDIYDDVDVESSGSYQVRAFNAAGQEIDDPVPHYNRGRTQLVPNLTALA